MIRKVSQVSKFEVFDSQKLGPPEVEGGPERFRKLREACRKSFPVVSWKLLLGAPTLGGFVCVESQSELKFSGFGRPEAEIYELRKKLKS